MKHIISFLILLVGAYTASLHAQNMNNERLGTLIDSVADSVDGQLGYWQAMVGERLILVITDEGHNRMRIISPIMESKDLEEKYLKNALIANFHTALDVKYAISEDILWSVFIHPLKELSNHQVKDAIQQVFYAAETFGSTYSSTDLVFPGGAGEGEEGENAPEKKKKKDKGTKM